MDNQKKLNEQGRQIQMDIWNDTNYGAQKQHMIDAGLNPALMYGLGGGGGSTTGSQGGGSASGGQAPAQPPMDMSNLLIGAQIEKLKAEAKLAEANAGRVPSEIDLNLQKGLGEIARAKNLDEDTRLKIEQRLKTVIETKGQDIRNDLDKLKLDAGATGSMYLDMLKSVGLDPLNNEDDKWIVRGIMTAYFGSDVVLKIAKAFPKGVGDLIMKFFGTK